MWITQLFVHNYFLRLHSCLTTAHNTGMKNANTSKNTKQLRQDKTAPKTAPWYTRISAEQMQLIMLTTPLIAQSIWAVYAFAIGQWVFACMAIPGFLSALVSLLYSLTQTHATQEHKTYENSVTLQQKQVPEIICRTTTLEQLLGLENSSYMWRSIVASWLQPPSSAVMIGIDETLAPTMLDIAQQGPHALVAGTTGSGKSVFLQTWCCAMACRNDAQHMQFVLLDFKGGSAFDILQGLPHTIGNVNDLDLRYATRALYALEKELTRRETLVSQYKVSTVEDLPEHIRPARLIIIIDEFHALQTQLDTMIARIVRIASLGRSLSMHVIACTQHPLGQVGADMKANMTLNICLRVRDSLQSVEMIGDSRASSISLHTPGRCYISDGSQTQLVQTAHCARIASLVEHIRAAHEFCAFPCPAQLFSEPLPRNISLMQIQHNHLYAGYESNNVQKQNNTSASANTYGLHQNTCAITQSEQSVEATRDYPVFALLDTNTTLEPLQLELRPQVIAIIGRREGGKSHTIHLLAQLLTQHRIPVSLTRRVQGNYITQEVNSTGTVISVPNTPNSSNSPSNTSDTVVVNGTDSDYCTDNIHSSCIVYSSNSVHNTTSDSSLKAWLIDDADEALHPLANDPLQQRIEECIRQRNQILILALTNGSLLKQTHAVDSTIIIPTADHATDLMNGIPSALLTQFDDIDYATAGRAVYLQRGRAYCIQIATLDCPSV